MFFFAKVQHLFSGTNSVGRCFFSRLAAIKKREELSRKKKEGRKEVRSTSLRSWTLSLLRAAASEYPPTSLPPSRVYVYICQPGGAGAALENSISLKCALAPPPRNRGGERVAPAARFRRFLQLDDFSRLGSSSGRNKMIYLKQAFAGATITKDANA